MYKQRRCLSLYRGKSSYRPSSKWPANSIVEGEVCPRNNILGIDSIAVKDERYKEPDLVKKTIARVRPSHHPGKYSVDPMLFVDRKKVCR